MFQESLEYFKLIWVALFALRWCLIGVPNSVKSIFSGANITTEGHETVESPQSLGDYDKIILRKLDIRWIYTVKPEHKLILDLAVYKIHNIENLYMFCNKYNKCQGRKLVRDRIFRLSKGTNS